MNNFTSAAFHNSAKTSLSTNIDAVTGVNTRVMTTSSVEMFWRDGMLVIRGRSSAVTLPAAARPVR